MNEILHSILFVITEASRLTPYQKTQQRRRQTIATHTSRPAKQSTFYRHAVRAIFRKLKGDGNSFSGAAKGGQLIAQWMLKKYGYANGLPDGNFRLTSKGKKRNKKHTSEPKSVRNKKDKTYDYIMGIQRKQKAQKRGISNKNVEVA